MFSKPFSTLSAVFIAFALVHAMAVPGASESASGSKTGKPSPGGGAGGKTGGGGLQIKTVGGQNLVAMKVPGSTYKGKPVYILVGGGTPAGGKKGGSSPGAKASGGGGGGAKKSTSSSVQKRSSTSFKRSDGVMVLSLRGDEQEMDLMKRIIDHRCFDETSKCYEENYPRKVNGVYNLALRDEEEYDLIKRIIEEDIEREEYRRDELDARVEGLEHALEALLEQD